MVVLQAIKTVESVKVSIDGSSFIFFNDQAVKWQTTALTWRGGGNLALLLICFTIVQFSTNVQ
jgi:hypothetical protein